MALLDQVKELKSQGKTVDEIAKELNIPVWLAWVLYQIV